MSSGHLVRRDSINDAIRIARTIRRERISQEVLVSGINATTKSIKFWKQLEFCDKVIEEPRK